MSEDGGECSVLAPSEWGIRYGRIVARKGVAVKRVVQKQSYLKKENARMGAVARAVLRARWRVPLHGAQCLGK